MKIDNSPKNPTTMPDVSKTPEAPAPVPISYPNVSDSVKKDLAPNSEKQARKVTQGHLAEQEISTSQKKSMLTNIVDNELPRGLGFLKSAPPRFIQELPAKIQGDLSALGKSLDANNLHATGEKFGDLISKVAIKDGKTDINELVQHVLRESYLETNKDLQYYKQKAEHLNAEKKVIREEIQKSKDADPSKIKEWEDKLNQLGDDAQLANVDLQNILQKQQQTLQMMSNISKMLYDTAMSVIRKMGG